MRMRTGLFFVTAGAVSLLVSRPLAQAQVATGPSKHAPSTQPNHPAGGWGGHQPPMGMMRGGHGGGGPFGGRPMQDGGFHIDHGNEIARAGSTDETRAIEDLTKQVKALTEQVKELRKAMADAADDEDDHGHRGEDRRHRDDDDDRQSESRHGSRGSDRDDRSSNRWDDRRRDRDDDDSGDRGHFTRHNFDHSNAWHHDGHDRD